MTLLRKCPSCHEMVGAESAVCPRCGARFRAVQLRHGFKWAMLLALVGWIVAHYVMKR